MSNNKLQIKDIFHKTKSRLSKLIRIGKIAEKTVNLFKVDDAKVAEILEAIRAELPTTEAILIGKPQAGKSSIVRGLTGVSPEIIGEGFRPHTTHTQRYAYPSDDLPLLIFKDTVGLGDVSQDIGMIIQELIDDLAPQINSDSPKDRPLTSRTTKSYVLILTVKINDFATDTLREIVKKLRETYPQIPCLLALTCLHEAYPTLEQDHPPYPPDFLEVQRSFLTTQENFQGLFEKAVLIDFTLEEDGYHPVFYGWEEFRDSLAELLPEAEARTIHQLLDNQVETKLGNIYRDVGRRYILAFTVIAATIAAVPLPFATMPVLTALEISMVTLLGQLYGQILTPSQAGGILSAIAGGFLARLIGRELIKFIPGFGSIIAASWAAAYTYALGEGACVYFGDLMGGKKPDPAKIQSVMQDAFKQGQEKFKSLRNSSRNKN
jgi:uncharacterized protein (DUF697 family)